MTAKVITHKWIIGRRECRLKTEIAMTKQVMFCQSLSFWNFLFRTIETLLIEGVVIFTESLIKINIFLHSTFGNDRYVKFYSTTRGFSLIAYAKTKQKSFYDKKSRSRKLEVDQKVLVLLPTHTSKLLLFHFVHVLFFVCIIFCLFLVSRIMIVLCSFFSLIFFSSKIFNFTDVLFYYVLANRQFRYSTSLQDKRKQRVFSTKNVYEIEKDLFPYVVWYLSRAIKIKNQIEYENKLWKFEFDSYLHNKTVPIRRHQRGKGVKVQNWPHIILKNNARHRIKTIY